MKKLDVVIIASYLIMASLTIVDGFQPNYLIALSVLMQVYSVDG